MLGLKVLLRFGLGFHSSCLDLKLIGKLADRIFSGLRVRQLLSGLLGIHCLCRFLKQHWKVSRSNILGVQGPPGLGCWFQFCS